jgi:hypothetical protein
MKSNPGVYEILPNPSKPFETLTNDTFIHAAPGQTKTFSFTFTFSERACNGWMNESWMSRGWKGGGWGGTVPYCP